MTDARLSVAATGDLHALNEAGFLDGSDALIA